MGINMHIKDTWEVTMEELMSMLPNSKAAKQVNQLIEGIEKLREENAYVNDMLENAHNRSKLLEAENERLRNRDGNAGIILCETTDTIPFHQERLKIIDFGVSDNVYMVERNSEI